MSDITKRLAETPWEISIFEAFELFQQFATDLPVGDTSQPETTREVLVSGLTEALGAMQQVSAEQAEMTDSTDKFVTEGSTEVVAYALALLENAAAIAAQASNTSLSQSMKQLTVPVALWAVQVEGTLVRLDLLVNVLAELANRHQEADVLAQLSDVLEKISAAVDDEIQRDADSENTMRPWRILNLNYAIVATRSQDKARADRAYEWLVKTLPSEAQGFFSQAMQQVDSGAYPESVKELVQRYYDQWCGGGSLH